MRVVPSCQKKSSTRCAVRMTHEGCACERMQPAILELTVTIARLVAEITELRASLDKEVLSGKHARTEAG